MDEEALTQTPPAGPLARKPAPLVSRSVESLEAAVGGRAKLVAALSLAPKSSDLDYVLGMVADPLSQDLPLAEICAAGGITPGELFDAYQKGVLAAAHVKAATRIAEALPSTVEDTLRLSVPHEDDCTACQGTATIVPEPSKANSNPGPVPCPICRGTGRLVFPGDLEHKKLALELGKLTSKGNGVVIDNRQAHLHAAGGSGQAAGGTLEALLRATDQILYGGGAHARYVSQPSRSSGTPDRPSVQTAPDPPVEGDVLDSRLDVRHDLDDTPNDGDDDAEPADA